MASSFVMRSVALSLFALLFCGCLVAHEEPAVRGMPRDDRSAPISAVWVGTPPSCSASATGRCSPIPTSAARSSSFRARPGVARGAGAAADRCRHPQPHAPRSFRRADVAAPRAAPPGGLSEGGEAYDDEILQPRSAPSRRGSRLKRQDCASPRFPPSTRAAAMAWTPSGTTPTPDTSSKGSGTASSSRATPVTMPRLPRDRGAVPGDRDRLHSHRAGQEGGRRGSLGHANPRQALDIFTDVGARYMVPIHFEAYYSRGTDHGGPRRDLLATCSHGTWKIASSRSTRASGSCSPRRARS